MRAELLWRSGPRLTRQQSARRAEDRTLVPCERRRHHLLLISEEDHRAENYGTPLHHYNLIAVVRPGERETLRQLVQRWRRGTEPYRLRLVEAEDGRFDLADLWHRGECVDDLAGSVS